MPGSSPCGEDRIVSQGEGLFSTPRRSLAPCVNACMVKDQFQVQAFRTLAIATLNYADAPVVSLNVALWR